MNSLVACIVIAHERRRALTLDRVVRSVRIQNFDDVVVVGDWADDGAYAHDVRYFNAGALTHTTLDALYKRDVGTLVTAADTLVYVNDDHALAPRFALELREVLNEGWDVLVPNRYTIRRENDLSTRFNLNNGERDGYCGGHGGVFKRRIVAAHPWMTGTHHRLWDLLISQEQIARGAKFWWKPRAEISIEDIEPNATPWK